MRHPSPYSSTLRHAWHYTKHWLVWNLTQVGFGQTICTPLRPRCEACSVAKLCPAAFKEASSSPSSKLKKSKQSKELWSKVRGTYKLVWLLLTSHSRKGHGIESPYLSTGFRLLLINYGMTIFSRDLWYSSSLDNIYSHVQWFIYSGAVGFFFFLEHFST